MNFFLENYASKYYENIFDLQFTVEYNSIFYFQIYKFSTFGLLYWKKFRKILKKSVSVWLSDS